jgi:2-polyprenyl-3-methyl-5-hydroxy-6-metoxy-1,4-benzoquinol methylase
MKITINAESKVAYESPDHIIPIGTKYDNSTNLNYIKEVENFFNRKPLNILDLGCAGGQLIVDFIKNGHNAFGIEGSDYNIKNKTENWVKYYEKNLWTADITKKIEIKDEKQEPVLFDLISCWEVVEHIHPNDLNFLFDQITSFLKPDGIFVASINSGHDCRRDEKGKLLFLHQSVFQENFWREEILKNRNIIAYPFTNVVRKMDNSFYIGIKK